VTPSGPATFKLTPAFGIGQLVWHRANREACGVVDSVVLRGRDDYLYRISWGSLEYTEERETTLSDERPTFDGPDHSDN